MVNKDFDHLEISIPHTSRNDSRLHVTSQPMNSQGKAIGPATHSSSLGAIAIGYAAHQDYYDSKK